jgi:hypothetical protein
MLAYPPSRGGATDTRDALVRPPGCRGAAAPATLYLPFSRRGVRRHPRCARPPSDGGGARAAHPQLALIDALTRIKSSSIHDRVELLRP